LTHAGEQPPPRDSLSRKCGAIRDLLWLFDYYGGLIVNTHSAPLPDFPGAHPIEDVLAAGAKETAATVHYVDEGVDSGAVIAAEPVPVHEGDTVDTLRERVKAVEHRLLPKAVRELIS